MPNHVINEVILHDIPLATAAPLLSGPKSGQEIDFNVLVPLPINYWAGNVSTLHEKAFPGTQLDAARKEWGTKWNAYGLNEDGRYVSVREVNGSTVLTFQTAWGPPRGWVVALFNTLDCRVSHHWLSEGGGAAHLEEYTTGGPFGPEWKDSTLVDGSEERRRLHKLLWGVETFDDDPEEPA